MPAHISEEYRTTGLFLGTRLLAGPEKINSINNQKMSAIASHEGGYICVFCRSETTP